MSRIRTLALALIKNDQNQYFHHEAYDSVKEEKFYRPLGGGIEFGELGEDALKREFLEEINQEIEVGDLLETFENIFVYEGEEGHQIILMYEAKFKDESNYSKNFKINESGTIVGNAVWRTVKEIEDENGKLYPVGLDKLIGTI
jgi:ADP-ribose pyrophosphatase YjhB (NUDIX family)